MDERVADAIRLLPSYLTQHVILSVSALTLGIVLSLPLAILAARNKKIRWPVLALASLVQTIPGLALLALFYPLLLGFSAIAEPVLGITIPALGFLPSLLALTLYSMLPILRNAVAGLTTIDHAIIEAADGVGMTPRQRLWRIETPLAAPVVMAGIRTAAVWTIGAATLATPVGQTTLGNFIFSGLQTENWVSVLFGCAAAAALALIVDQLLGLIEIGAARRDRRRILIGITGLAVGTASAFAPLISKEQTSYVVGAKNFSEQFILAELISSEIKHHGATVARKDGLGSAVAFRALVNSDIDVYIDYSGTLWTNVLGRNDIIAREPMLHALSDALRQRFGVVVVGPLGFENAYVLAMQQSRASALGARTIADLTVHASNLVLGSDLEFLSRPEWSSLRETYGLAFRTERSFNPTFMYRAIATGDVDVITAFSSDGRIDAQKLQVLEDPKHAIPAYDALILIAPKRATDAVLRRALQPLINAISVERMREANLMVDRDINKMSPQQAAEHLAHVLKLR
ncbi:MAG TPA: ABC transporter permease/substrate-binding protein, partial [Xanthobacteraceae bacterium]|nr:ABC transporter permease/substrate-binding protein [Xanthobacteraceae bacterium]